MSMLLDSPREVAKGAATLEEVICVDENDQCVGFIEKHAAHRGGGILHRAFSVFVFDSAGRILLQQRAFAKYHFGGRWTNACCSHPRRDEPLENAAHRRLREELGFDTPLREIFSFVYQAHDADSGLSEWEYDHVFLGHFEGEPTADPAEVADWKWMDVHHLRHDVASNPERYTAWFRLALEKVLTHLQPPHPQPTSP